VLSLRPDLVEARLHLATFMLEAGNASEARPLLEDALKYDPSNVLVHLNLGDAYRSARQAEGRARPPDLGLAQGPSMAQAQYNQGLVYLFSANVPGVTEEQAIDRGHRVVRAFQEARAARPRAAPATTWMS
jgi:tetratricopeptide (TPR) repeat protein